MQILCTTARHPVRSEILYRRILDEIGEATLAAARRRGFAAAREHTPLYPEARVGVPDRQKPYTKYLDVGYYLRRDVARALDLDLHHARRHRVLDIGCGNGSFLAACRHLGHAIQGLDLDGMPVFDELTRILGIPRWEHEIRPGEPLPRRDCPPFDLISAFNVRFDRSSDGKRWCASDWEFFLEDVRSRLAPGGHLIFKWNQASRGLLREHARRELFSPRTGFDTRFMDATKVSFRRIG